MAITFKQIDAKIATFVTNRDALKSLGHEVAMMIVRHAAPASLPDCDGSGDVSRALKLAQVMPKSWAVQLCEWFAEYTPIRVIPKNDKCGLTDDYKKLDKKDKPAEWDLEGAAANPFYDMVEPDPAAKMYDFNKLLQMVQRIATQIDKKVEKGEVKPEDVESAKAIAATIHGLRFTPVPVAIDEPANNNSETTDTSGTDESDQETPSEETAGAETPLETVELKVVNG